MSWKKNGHFDKYQYSRYGVGFDERKNFSLCDGSGFGKKNLYGADMSLSTHVDNRKKYILTFGKAPMEGSEEEISLKFAL